MKLISRYLIVYYENEKILQVDQEHVHFVGDIPYFPMEYLPENFQISSHRSSCIWKGEARYFDLHRESGTIPNIAWQYFKPKDSFTPMENFFACDPKLTKLRSKKTWNIKNMFGKRDS